MVAPIFLPGSPSQKSLIVNPILVLERGNPTLQESSDIPQRLEGIGDGICEVFVRWDTEVLAAVTWSDSKDFDLTTYEQKIW